MLLTEPLKLLLTWGIQTGCFVQICILSLYLQRACCRTVLLSWSKVEAFVELTFRFGQSVTFVASRGSGALELTKDIVDRKQRVVLIDIWVEVALQ